MSRPPIRVKLERSRGWRMPANTVKVDRTTAWGNPYDVNEYGREFALHLFGYTARGCWSPANVRELDEPTAPGNDPHGGDRAVAQSRVAGSSLPASGKHMAAQAGMGNAAIGRIGPPVIRDIG